MYTFFNAIVFVEVYVSPSTPSTTQLSFREEAAVEDNSYGIFAAVRSMKNHWRDARLWMTIRLRCERENKQ